MMEKAQFFIKSILIQCNEISCMHNFAYTLNVSISKKRNSSFHQIPKASMIPKRLRTIA